MKWLKIIGGAVLAVVVVALVLGSVLPSEYRVERATQIAAPPAVVYGEVSSLKKWQPWSPWIARDPSIESTYSGPDEGVGAKVSWTSKDSGSGSQEIVVAEPGARIETAMDFGSQGGATADFRFEATAEGTRVTWGMSGDMPGPLGGLLAGQMEGWIGPDYEDGLARLKRHVEALPPPAPEPEAVAPPTDGGTPDAAL